MKKNYGWLLAVSTFFVLTCSMANAGLILIEPDNFAVGTDIRAAFPGVKLSVTGEPETEVQSLIGFSEFLNKNIATTGTFVFGQSPGTGPIIPPYAADNAITWDEDYHGLLRADFDRYASLVQVDLIFDDNDTAGLWAYDSSGNLLDSFIASGDGRGPVPFVTATIARSAPDIAYVMAGGVGAEASLLDNLRVNMVPEPMTIALFGFGLALIYSTNNRKKCMNNLTSRHMA